MPYSLKARALPNRQSLRQEEELKKEKEVEEAERKPPPFLPKAENPISTWASPPGQVFSPTSIKIKQFWP